MNNKYIRRPLSAVMAALVLMSGAAALGGAASLDASASQLTASASSVVSASYLSADTIIKGSSVYVYGKVTGGTETNYSYAYYMKKHSSEKWSTIKGFSSAKYTAMFAWLPAWGCTFAASAPKSSFARSIASCSTSSTNSQPL